MDDVSYIALSKATGLKRNLEVVANNMANANTAGFKGDSLLFSEYLNKTMGVSKENRETSLTQDKMTLMDERQGSLQQTNNPLDVAIQGGGWFGYQLDNGEQAFSRNGQLLIDGLGNLVNAAGASILDIGGGTIAIDPESIGSINISNDGTISDSNGNVISQIGVFDVENIQNLVRIGSGMLRMEEGQALIPSFDSTLAQGFVENSNVQAVVEMTKMMAIERSYGHVTKLMQNAHDLEKNTISRLGRAAN